jgi:hypothetical protein
MSVDVDEATTFGGFCEHHDNSTFKIILESDFNSSPEALFLYAYRALCSCLYTEEVKYELPKAILESVRERPVLASRSAS